MLESFICVCFAVIHTDQSSRLRLQCQCKTSMTSPIHTASSPHISHALSRHIPQQREMPRVIIHQSKPFMAHQKTMNCQSERSACNMKRQRILQTQIKQCWIWENYRMFGQLARSRYYHSPLWSSDKSTTEASTLIVHRLQFTLILKYSFSHTWGEYFVFKPSHKNAMPWLQVMSYVLRYNVQHCQISH